VTALRSSRRLPTRRRRKDSMRFRMITTRVSMRNRMESSHRRGRSAVSGGAGNGVSRQSGAVTRTPGGPGEDSMRNSVLTRRVNTEFRMESFRRHSAGSRRDGCSAVSDIPKALSSGGPAGSARDSTTSCRLSWLLNLQDVVESSRWRWAGGCRDGCSAVTEAARRWKGGGACDHVRWRALGRAGREAELVTTYDSGPWGALEGRRSL